MQIDVEIPTCREGVMVPTPFAGPKEIVEVTLLAEELGYNAIWGTDFIAPTPFRKLPAGENPNWYELMTSLSYLAAVTRRIKLGAGVIMLPLRDTVILAKQAATLDQFSNGRFLLGVGLGTSREEFLAVHPGATGVHRANMMEEQMEALRLLLNGEDGPVSFKGQYVEFDNLNLNPKPMQRPLPIYITAKNEEALRRAARWGHGVMVASSYLDEGIGRLKGMLQEQGRDLSEIDVVVEYRLCLAKTRKEAVGKFFASRVSGIRKVADMDRYVEENWIGTPSEVADRIAKVKAKGFDHLVALHVVGDSVEEMKEQMRILAEDIVPQVK